MVRKIKKIVYSLIQKRRKKSLTFCGENSVINADCYFKGNVNVGKNCSIGKGAFFISVRANINIHDYVVFGPNVTIYTGDHPTDVIGRHISEITEELKVGQQWDKDVTIESGCWIGTRAIILKGITIGKGSIIGAGAVVTKDVPPYSIYVGVPNARTFARFTEEEIKEHERILTERGLSPDSWDADLCH